MKKTFVAVLATVLMSFGLVATTTSPAEAACPYTNCIPTKTKPKIQKNIPVGSKAKVCIKVKAVGSNATPVGGVKFNIRHADGETILKTFVPYNGGNVCLATKTLTRPGKYAFRARFKAPNPSVFLKSNGVKKFRVVS